MRGSVYRITKVQVFKKRNIKLSSLYNRLKKKLDHDDFRIISDIVTENVYHLRAEKAGIKEIVIGAVRDIELVIAGDSTAFVIIFTVGAWGKNITVSGGMGYVVASLAAGPGVVWGGIAATGSYVQAIAYEKDFWEYILKEIDHQESTIKKSSKEGS